ncbi:S8 family peptidase [Ramlibacter solisilvae]|uniref:S8 family peptidase n=1 Tax=Ramlibacter tataouinensis TaxID=94132 RepID=UPI000777DFF2|nr:S8 family peptidase [Ramlibacter tataouinensis]
MNYPKLPSRLLAIAGTALVLLAPLAHAQNSERANHPYGAGRPIAGRYIVTFKSNVTDPRGQAAGLAAAHGGQLHHAYSHAFKGFAATLPDAAVQALRHNPNIEHIEQDATVSLQQLASPQNQATWGLDRLDQVDLPLDTQYHFNQTGAGVYAFIVDTGIRADHSEFSGRVMPGYGAIADGNGTNDCNGHGTHVAGTVGGTTWGVAKGVKLVPVRVLDCSGSGSWSAVIAGIDWLAASNLRPAVANLSLGGAISATVDAAVAGAVAKGVTMVVAAGNNNGQDACQYSPAREPSAITVGATSNSDYRAYFSNIGTCVDLFAPGYNITSAWHASPTASNTISGTSMAAPHVVGVAALVLQNNPSATPAAVTNAILSGATVNHVTGAGTGSPNLLLSSPGATGAPATQPPTATVAFKTMVGSATRSGGNWKANAAVSVRDISTGAAVANATVAGTFSTGGSASCVTGSTGNCTLSSTAIKSNAGASTTFTGTGISGSLMTYDATQNAVTQIVISKP